MPNEPVMQLNDDGTWTEATPTPLHPGLDFEVAGTGPFEWEAWDGMTKVASGHAQTRIGLYVAMFRARHKHPTP